MRITAAVLLIAFSFTPFSASCQDEAQRYKTGEIKVGDRVLADPIGLGKPDTCTVIGTNELTGNYRPGYTNQYQIRCDHNAWSTVPATGDKVKLAGQANVLSSGAAASAQPSPGANKYGTRDPHTCVNTKAPAGATIDSAHAKQYFICQAEKYQATCCTWWRMSTLRWAARLATIHGRKPASRKWTLVSRPLPYAAVFGIPVQCSGCEIR